MRNLVLLGLVTLFTVTPVLAQSGKEPVKGTFDFRVAWVGQNQASNLGIDNPVYVDLGIKVNRYLGESQRLSFRFSFDYLSSERSFDKENPADYPWVKEWPGFLPNVGLELDLIRIPHINLSVHGGIADLIGKRSLSLGGNNLCDNSEYSKYCGVHGQLLGNAGSSLRFSSHHFKKDSFYGGVSYTAFTRNTRQIILFLGSTF